MRGGSLNGIDILIWWGSACALGVRVVLSAHDKPFANCSPEQGRFVLCLGGTHWRVNDDGAAVGGWRMADGAITIWIFI